MRDDHATQHEGDPAQSFHCRQCPVGAQTEVASVVEPRAAEEEANVLDSHDQRFVRVRQSMQHERRCVRVAADSIRMLAERVGPVNTEEIPRAIRHHQWSGLNVPLLWAASIGDRDHPVLQWLLEVSATIPQSQLRELT